MPPVLVVNALVILPSMDACARASIEYWGRKKCASFFTRATSTELRILLKHRFKVASQSPKYALATSLANLLKRRGLQPPTPERRKAAWIRVLGEQEFEQQLLAEEALAASSSLATQPAPVAEQHPEPRLRAPAPSADPPQEAQSSAASPTLEAALTGEIDVLSQLTDASVGNAGCTDSGVEAPPVETVLRAR